MNPFDKWLLIAIAVVLPFAFIGLFIQMRKYAKELKALREQIQLRDRAAR